MTLDKAVVDIIAREFVPRLRYIAVLRVKTLSSIMFEKLFDFSLFTTLLGPTSIAREADLERRRIERILPENASDRDT